MDRLEERPDPMSSKSDLEVLSAVLCGADAGNRWPDVVREANLHMIAPALYKMLDDRSAQGLLPGELRDYLSFLFDLNEQRNRRLHQQAVELIRDLNGAGVEPLLIKGTALLMTVPESRRGTRMISDLDLVVDRAALEPVAECLQRLGYLVLPGDHGRHALGKFYRPSDVGTVDLQFRPPGPAHLFDEGPGPSSRIQVDGVHMRVPTPAEWVVQLIVHDMIQDHRLRTGKVEMRRLLDCQELLAMGFKIDWDEVRARLSSFRLALARDVFLMNLERLAGVQVDGGVSGLLPNLLFARQIAIRRSDGYRRLDLHGLSLMRTGYRAIRLIG